MNIEQNDDKLISAPRGLYELRSEWEEYRDRVKSTRKQDLRDKALYGQFFRQTEDLSNENNWLWLKRGSQKGSGSSDYGLSGTSDKN